MSTVFLHFSLESFPRHELELLLYLNLGPNKRSPSKICSHFSQAIS
ncbi:unnamed protein product [Haemonchus placei]|uniref:HTH_48 domain-containing protein n=1 Tax=Haemonchus placei TaxID=6290 RepID=A0A0N4VZE3_HAEPC|nr:unnamed protein product [Haemonchus placei]